MATTQKSKKEEKLESHTAELKFKDMGRNLMGFHEEFESKKSQAKKTKK